MSQRIPPLAVAARFPLIGMWLILGCGGKQPAIATEAPPKAVPGTPGRVQEVTRVEVEDLHVLACAGDTCAWADSSQLHPIDPGSLEPAGPTIPLPFPPSDAWSSEAGIHISGSRDGLDCHLLITPGSSDLQEECREATPAGDAAQDDEQPSSSPQEILDGWRHVLEERWRLPFQRSVPTAHGGLLTYTRTGSAGFALMRTGGGIRQVAAPGLPSAPTCLGSLTIHPSGLEAYLLPWPVPVLVGFDSRALTRRWSMELPEPALGLFMDPGGRFLVLALARPDPERWEDHPPVQPLPGSEVVVDPLTRGWLHLSHLPDSHGVALVDASGPSLEASLQGPFRAWVQIMDGALLASRDEVVRLQSSATP